MTDEEKASLAEQITTNPLFAVLMDELQQNAVSRMYAAQDDMARLSAQAYARAAQSFRTDCEAWLRNTRERKAAPA